MIGKKKYMVLIVGLVSLGLLLSGGTYAWLTFNANVVNGTYNADSTCFMIDYSAGDAITGTLFQSSTPKGGLSGSVTMKIKSSCSASGTGNIKLNVGTDTSSLLLSDDGALKYAVYENINSNPVSSGTISSTGDMNLYSNFALAGPSEAAKTYYIYVWLDGNIADNDYVNLSFSGNISASATQNETSVETGDAYAIYSVSDNSLRFYKNNDFENITVDDTYQGRAVTALYDVDEAYYYNESGGPEWSYDIYSEDITSVVFENTISPVDTSYWFSNLANCNTFDIAKLNVSNVVYMEYMFAGSGMPYEGMNFSLDLSGWNTSNVVNMNGVFYSFMAYSSTGEEQYSVSLNVSGWDVSSVTNMYEMFEYFALTSSSLNVIGLSSWNVENVEDHNEFVSDGETRIQEPNWNG